MSDKASGSATLTSIRTASISNNWRLKQSVQSTTKAISPKEKPCVECCLCGNEHQTEKCPKILAGLKVLDKPVPSRARLTLPDNLLIVPLEDTFKKLMVVAKTSIANNTIFGPLQAPKILNKKSPTGYKIFEDDGKVLELDCSDEHKCNWMSLVNFSTPYKQNNVIAYQMNKQIYFCTNRQLNPGEELLVGFSKTYRKNIDKISGTMSQEVETHRQVIKILDPSNYYGDFVKNGPRTIIYIDEDEIENNDLQGTITQKLAFLTSNTNTFMTPNTPVSTDSSPSVQLSGVSSTVQVLESAMNSAELSVQLVNTETAQTTSPTDTSGTVKTVSKPTVIKLSSGTSAKPSTLASTLNQAKEIPENLDTLSSGGTSAKPSTLASTLSILNQAKEIPEKIDTSPIVINIDTGSGSVKVDSKLLTNPSTPKTGTTKKVPANDESSSDSNDVPLCLSEDSDSSYKPPDPVEKDSTEIRRSLRKRSLTPEVSAILKKGQPIPDIKRALSNSESTSPIKKRIYAPELSVILKKLQPPPIPGIKKALRNSESIRSVPVVEKTEYLKTRSGKAIPVIKKYAITSIKSREGGVAEQTMEKYKKDFFKDLAATYGNEVLGITAKLETWTCSICDKKFPDAVELAFDLKSHFEATGTHKKNLHKLKLMTRREAQERIKGGEDKDKDKDVQEKDKDVQEEDKGVQEKDKDVQEKDKDVQDEDKDVEGKDKDVEGKDKDVQEKDKDVQEKDKDVEDKSKGVEESEKNCKDETAKGKDTGDEASEGEDQNDGEAEKDDDWEPEFENNDKYTCDLCGKTNVGRHNNYRHLQKHTGDFYCRMCKKVYSCQSSIKNHFCEANPKEWICDVCNKKCLTQEGLKNHKYCYHSNPRFPCKKCGKRYHFRSKLRAHTIHCKAIAPEKTDSKKKKDKDKDKDEDDDGRNYECKTCNKIFHCKSRYEAHLPIHTGEFTCQFCGRWLSSLMSLKEHVAACMKLEFPAKTYRGHDTMDEDGRINCSFCNEVFTDLIEYRTHTYRHSVPFECQICGHRAHSNHELNQHACFEREFKCKVCNQVFAAFCNLKQHRIEENHNDPPPLPAEELEAMKNQSFTCHVCNNTFATKNKLKHHSIVHDEKRFTCNICNRKFLRKKGMERHILTHGEKTLPCPYCPQLFKCKGSLRMHIKYHEGIRDFACHLCDKKFLQLGNLNKHLDTHDKNKRYYCSFCPKNFSGKDSLDNHERVHKFGKNIKCQICGKSYLKPHQLRKHMAHIHSNQSYSCKYCKVLVKLKRSILRHLKKKHSEYEHEWKDMNVVDKMMVICDEQQQQQQKFDKKLGNTKKVMPKRKKKVKDDTSDVTSTSEDEDYQYSDYSNNEQSKNDNQDVNVVYVDGDGGEGEDQAELEAEAPNTLMHFANQISEIDNQYMDASNVPGEVYTHTNFETGEVVIFSTQDEPQSICEERVISNEFEINHDDTNSNFVMYVDSTTK